MFGNKSVFPVGSCFYQLESAEGTATVGVMAAGNTWIRHLHHRDDDSNFWHIVHPCLGGKQNGKLTISLKLWSSKRREIQGKMYRDIHIFVCINKKKESIKQG